MSNGLSPVFSGDGASYSSRELDVGYEKILTYREYSSGPVTAPPVTATPEPGVMTLLATGLAGLLVAAMRRKTSTVPA